MSPRLRVAAPWLALLVVASALRLPALTAGLPYLTYVDEGHVMHHVTHLFNHRTWVPATYSYPTLPFYAIGATALAYAPLYSAAHGRRLLDDLGPSPAADYDLVQPVDYLLLGRGVTLAASLGLVLLAGLLARRLAGPPAGYVAAWWAALVPALVARSSVVNVNPMAVFLVLAALLFAERLRTGERPRRDALLAGAMTGLAAVSKYPCALVCLPVALAALLSPGGGRARLSRLALAASAALAAAAAGMPALALRPGDVLRGLRGIAGAYEDQKVGSYWNQAVRRAEWDLPLSHPEVGIVFLLLSAGGILVALGDRRWSRPLWGWLLFGAATGALFAGYEFRAFRNLLHLVPLGCVLVALLYARLRAAARRPLGVDLAAALMPALLFAPALHGYLGYQLALVDSRERAVRWLAAHTGPGDTILFPEELAFMPARLARLGDRVDVRPWATAKRRMLSRNVEYVVVGTLLQPDGSRRVEPERERRALSGYAVVTSFGSKPTRVSAGDFKGNALRIRILRRR